MFQFWTFYSFTINTCLFNRWEKYFKNCKFEERPVQSGGPSLQAASREGVGLGAGPSAGAPCSEGG